MVPDVPPAVVTLTFLAESAAVAGIVNVAVRLVELTIVTALTVMSPPETFTAVDAVKFVPVIVTGTAVPWAPC